MDLERLQAIGELLEEKRKLQEKLASYEDVEMFACGMVILSPKAKAWKAEIKNIEEQLEILEW